MKSRWLAVFPAFALACAGLGHKDENRSQTARAQDRAQSAFQKAADAQKRANDEQAKSEDAQRQVTDAQKALAEAQARAQGQQAKAEQAQAEAKQLAQDAQSEAQDSQDQAQQLQRSEADQSRQLHQENQQAWTQTRSLDGKVFQASSDTLKIRAGDRDVSLRVDDSTAVSIDGQSGSAAQIAPGSDVRASYQMVDGQATALRIEATSNTGSDQPSNSR